jgi:hypothetical protein
LAHGKAEPEGVAGRAEQKLTRRGRRRNPRAQVIRR